MAELIYGPSIDSLTRDVLGEVARLHELWPDTRAIILVPENRKLATERRYMDTAGASGLMMAEVLSFSRLSFRIFDLAGLRPQDRLSREGQAMLLAALIEEHKDELKLFSRLASRSGYVEQILAVLGYLRRFGIRSEQLLATATNSSDQQLHAKFHDLALLLEHYNRSLAMLDRTDSEQGLEDLACLLESLVDGRATKNLQKRLAVLKDTWIWLTGFGETRDFTPQEYRILTALDALCHKLSITVVTDSLVGDRASSVHVHPAYQIGSETAHNLGGFLGISQSRYVSDNRRQVPLLASILAYEEALSCDEESRRYLENFLRLQAATSVQDEVNRVAAEIRRLALGGHYRYRDMAICLLDTNSYLPLIRSTFPAYEIPAFIDSRRSLADTPILRFILAMLDTASSNWQAAHLLAFLRSGPFPIAASETDLLENYWLATGMHHSGIFYMERYPTELRELVETRLLPLRRPLEALRTKKTCRSLTDAFRSLLRHPNLDLATWVASEVERLSAAEDSDHAVSLAKAWNSLGQILSDLDELFGDRPFDLAMLRRILQVAAESNYVGVIPSDLDQVSIGPATEIVGSECKLLFVLGARSGLLPPSNMNTGLLKDSDCEVLSEEQDVHLPGLNDDQVQSDAFIVRQLLFTPSQKLYLSYSGSRSEASTVLQRLADALNLAIEQIPKQIESPDDYRLLAADELRRQLILRDARAASAQTVEGAGEDTAAWEALRRCLAATDPSPTSTSVPGEPEPDTDLASLTHELLRHMPNISVSALETYAACPYEYLSKYLLRVSDREIAEPTAMNRGSLLHAAFELAFSELSLDLLSTNSDEEREAVWTSYLERDPELEGERIYREALTSQADFLTFDSDGYRYAAGWPVQKVIRMAWPALLRQLWESNYMPYRFEHSFGERNPIPALQVRTEDGLIINLRGTIDRVDIRHTESGQIGFCVVDYKSSEHKIDYDALFEGLDLQILTYLEAVMASGLPGVRAEDLLAEEAMYVRLDEQHHSIEQMPGDYDAAVEKALAAYYQPSKFKRSPEELDLLMEMNRENRMRLTEDILAGRFGVEPKMSGGDRTPCDYCEHRFACRVEKPLQQVRRLAGLKRLAAQEGEKPDVEALLLYLRKRYGRDN